MKELEKEFVDLQLELKELEREVEYHQLHTSSANPDDLFLPTTEGFVTSTKVEFDRFEALLKEMKKKFKETLAYFGEDPSDSGAPSVEEMFGTFAVFLQSFSVSAVEHGLISSQPPLGDHRSRYIMMCYIDYNILQDTYQDVITTRKRKEEARKRKEELVGLCN